MTEQEAKTKWCPMGGLLAAAGTAIGMMGGATITQSAGMIKDSSMNKCMGSACMMWRGHTAKWPTGREIVEKNGDRRSLAPEVVDVNVGYCGLAGKP